MPSRNRRSSQSRDRVPVEVRPAWEISTFMLNQLSEALSSGTTAKIFHVTFDFKNPDHVRTIDGFSSEQVIEWMKANGYEDEVYELTLKSICTALAHDLLEFAGAAVLASLDGRLTVAHALLRKPFKENLFYIEWILADPDDFFRRFFAGETEALSLGKMDEARKVRIIRDAMATTRYSEWIEPEFLYELRYDKKSLVSLEPTWQKANHLITTQGALRTEAENFNFVFSDPTARNTQLRGFYASIPILFFHALQMIESMISMFAQREAPDLVPLRTLIGMDLWMATDSCAFDLADVKHRIHRVVTRTLQSLRCFQCKGRFSVAAPSLHAAFDRGELPCHKCGWVMPLHDPTL